MLTYSARRLLQLPIILFGVTILIFAMMTLVTPYERLALHVADQPERTSDVNALVELYGLDDPIPVQYVRWLGRIVQGDLGFSYRGHPPGADALMQHLPSTLELALWSIIPIMFVGIRLGVLAAVNQNKPIDHAARIFSIIGWSFPIYVFGLLVLMIFYAKLDWFPAGRLSEWALRATEAPTYVHVTYMNTIDSLINARLDIFLDAVRHLVLPVISLSYLSWALILRVTRSSMLEALRQDYVTTARAKGLPESVVIGHHVQRNAMIPVVTIGSLTLIGLMGGVVITETVFNIHGLGWFFADSATHLDVISVLGFTLFYAVLVVIGNLGADILYAYLDPRVRYS
ncbi:MAG TPA: ABC transporter permease [Anaerolineales bacterium]|nr:ABC transporter permease [Anaerolineales bacterium]